MGRPLDVSEVGYNRDAALLRRIAHRIEADSDFKRPGPVLAQIEAVGARLAARAENFKTKKKRRR